MRTAHISAVLLLCCTNAQSRSSSSIVLIPGGSVTVSCSSGQGGARPVPTALGGARPVPTALGGARPVPTALGGARPVPTALGGAVSTGGINSTGGTTGPSFPTCRPDSSPTRDMARHYPLGGKVTTPRIGMQAKQVSVTGASVFWPSLCPVLDQGALGSCTGNDACQTSSTPPYTRTCAQATEAAAVQCYQDASHIDYGCAWSSTCSQCPQAFCAATNANDQGSSAKSAFQAGIYLGWFKGIRPVTQTLQGWHDALLLGPCGFDQNWYNDGFTPSQCGEVVLTGGLAGGHSTEAVGWDVPNGRMWLRNSWGNKWGVAGGYFFYSLASLQQLLASGATMVCPAV